MKRTFIFFVLTSLLGLACSNSNSGKEHSSYTPKTKVEGVHPLCYVFCDFSTSQGKASEAAIAQNAVKIFKAQMGKCEMRFYDISVSNFGKPFFSHEMRTIRMSKPSEIKKMALEDAERVNMLKYAIDSLYKIQRPKTTCIVKNIGRAADDFINYDPTGEAHFKIVFLSDMLEFCEYDFGKILIEKSIFKQAFSSLSKMRKPTITLDKFPNLQLFTIVSSEKPIHKCDSLNLFWNEVFKHYNYNKTLPLSSVIPGAILK
jgi:hypothetical protein